MKKILMVMVMVLVTIAAEAGTVDFGFSLQSGLVPTAGGIPGYDPNNVPKDIPDSSFYLYESFTAQFDFFNKLISVGGTARIDMFEDGVFNFHPNLWPIGLDSTFFAQVQYGPFTLRWQHECIHPVSPWGGKSPILNSAYDDLSLRISAEIKLF